MTTSSHMRKFKQEKLWRDRMPQLCEAKGSIIHIKPLSDQEFDLELRVKLLEEAEEIKVAQTPKELIEELADLYEVIDTLIVQQGIDKDKIIAFQNQKRSEKGGFAQRKFVTVAEHQRGSFSENYCLAQPKKYPEIL